jgi:hypothetical protein
VETLHNFEEMPIIIVKMILRKDKNLIDTQIVYDEDVIKFKFKFARGMDEKKVEKRL